jgi:signal transduction histidine kinase
MRPRTLRFRLFAWFFGGIVLAIAAGIVVFSGTGPQPVTGAEVMARNVGTRLAEAWDQPEATRAYVGEVRDVTGFEVRLVRDPRHLPPRVHAMAARGIAIVPENPHHIFIPVVRGGTLAGALEMEKFGPRPAVWPWWRLALGLLLVVVVLSLMAGRVANQLARPLERLAHAADRLGGGDLAFRADVTGRRRWVAVEVHDVAVSFNRMADRVEAMVRGQRELLGAISHELRSPLGRARVALEIARDRLPAGASPDRSPAPALDDVEKQLGAVDAILGELLDVTRAGLADLRKETRPFVDWLGARAAEEPAPPVVVVDAASDVRALAVAFDPALLGRVVHNLLVNARAHGHPEALPLEVSVARDRDVVRVAVRDHGPGFAPGFAERAFEPFVRGDVSRARPTSGAGYGLGLAIVKRVVEAHGGRVFAHNVPPPIGAGAPIDRLGTAPIEKPGTAPIYKPDAGAVVGFELPVAPTSR